MLRLTPLALLLAAVAPGAAGAADADHGEALARRWCVSCHVVSDDQQHAVDNVPTFASIADRPNFDVESTVRFLRDPHPKMPDMQLSTIEASDLAAYIARLKR